MSQAWYASEMGIPHTCRTQVTWTLPVKVSRGDCTPLQHSNCSRVQMGLEMELELVLKGKLGLLGEVKMDSRQRNRNELWGQDTQARKSAKPGVCGC